MTMRKALDKWLASVSEDGGDSPLDLAESAFAAGWRAARPIIHGTSQGHLLYGGGHKIGELSMTLHGETDDGQAIELVMDEQAAKVLIRSLNRTALPAEMGIQL